MMDVVIKIPLVVVFIYSWDYIAPYLTHSDFTASTSPESAMVRFFSWTGIYLTKVVSQNTNDIGILSADGVTDFSAGGDVPTTVLPVSP